MFHFSFFIFSAQKFIDSETKENKFLCHSTSAISSDPKSSRKLHSHYVKLLGSTEGALEEEIIDINPDDDKEDSAVEVNKSAKAASPNLLKKKKKDKKIAVKRKQPAAKGSSGKKQNTNQM